MDKYILALDLGTTAIKVAVVDMAGRLAATSTREYKLLTPDTLSVELGVETYWEAFKAGVREALSESGVPGSSLACLGISAQGETLILIDESGNPLRNAIVWMDNRAQKEAAELSEQFPQELTYKITGQVSIVPTWPASKLLWIKKHEPEVFRKIHKVLLIEDYFIYRLTGKFACQGSLICSTVYWDINTKKWWPGMLKYLGISEAQLPEIYEPGEVVGPVKNDIAGELGVSEGMTVCTGALDQAAGTIGVGNIAPGLFSENTGAALAICATVNGSFMDPAFQMPCHYHGIKDLYMAHTFTTGGMALKWFRDAFCDLEVALGAKTGLDDYYLMDEEAKRIPPGSDGLVMLPHLQGAMAPEANPKAKGVYFGITLKHTRAHFIRAVMEGVGFIVMRNIEAIESMKIPVREIRVLGGGSRSAVWNQIKADITGRVIWTTGTPDAACLGAAIISGVSCGLFPTVKEAVEKMVTLKRKFEPDLENHRRYRKLFEEYKQLYAALCPLFESSD
ncbi:MAG: FGGY-family carbohydrate kinase [Treponema sp.]|jgi:xylulokinase|nr:FGGY-family carbohydrate kinase [Treponema sp.]